MDTHTPVRKIDALNDLLQRNRNTLELEIARVLISKNHEPSDLIHTSYQF
jgi:hypothetical protein